MTRTRSGVCPELVARFQRLHTEQPRWAWPYAPSIPFVGDQYRPDDGLLVYASAENFTWMTKKDVAVPERFTGDGAWDRYRARYVETNGAGSGFFPDIGIQPVTDGGLVAAAWLVATKLGLPTADEPRAFTETAAFTNWAKFTVKSDGAGSAVNEDYADVQEKLGASLAFVVTELAVLRPKVVLVPKTIWQWPLFQAAMRGASPFTCFVPVPQFNATVVNCHLCDCDRQGQLLRRKLAGTPLATWMRNLDGFREDCAWRYLACLEKALAERDTD